LKTAYALTANFIRSGFAVKFAHIQVTTECNAKCVDRCNIWATKHLEIPFEDLKLAIDKLAKNNFSVIYFTGGEPTLYPYILDALKYVKSKNLLTSITSNGTITPKQLWEMRGYLDLLSISVDHFDEEEWDKTKRMKNAAMKAKNAIKIAQKYGINVTGLTFINPHWTTTDVEKMVKFTNKELGTTFAFCYPYISDNEGTFTVGKDLTLEKQQRNLQQLLAKIKSLKEQGYDITDLSEYLEDVQLAHKGLHMKHKCAAGRNVLVVDTNLNVFPCFKRGKMFNLKTDEFKLITHDCPIDDKNCLTTCFKEPSIVSGRQILSLLKSEGRNVRTYMRYLKGT
jgi:MoaA/NifB/PqqE/SkfB family radical SAM enzyme